MEYARRSYEGSVGGRGFDSRQLHYPERRTLPSGHRPALFVVPIRRRRLDDSWTPDRRGPQARERRFLTWRDSRQAGDSSAVSLDRLRMGVRLRSDASRSSRGRGKSMWRGRRTGVPPDRCNGAAMDTRRGIGGASEWLAGGGQPGAGTCTAGSVAAPRSRARRRGRIRRSGGRLARRGRGRTLRPFASHAHRRGHAWTSIGSGW
ncbi:MAG: hypothetical protein JWM27_4659 [Gemmatimonadetes bacterium]|nr:hypothetical protein [Gemmatimonadota bacterium]